MKQVVGCYCQSSVEKFIISYLRDARHGFAAVHVKFFVKQQAVSHSELHKILLLTNIKLIQISLYIPLQLKQK